MASRKLTVEFIGDTANLERAFGRTKQQTGHLGRSLGLLAAGGLAAVAVGFKSVTEAAERSQVSNTRLQAQLRALGISYKAHAKEIDGVIQKTSQLSGLDDEDLQDAFTNIIRVTDNVSKSMKLTGLAADFARAKHIEVAKAGEIVAKVAGGNTGILSRYGIQIEKGASATEALGLLQKKFAGQAKAYGDTAAGAQDRFKVATENLQEAIGSKLLPALTPVINAMSSFVLGLTNGTGAGGRFVAVIKEIGNWLGKNVLPAVHAASAAVGEFVGQMRAGTGAGGRFVQILKDAAAWLSGAFTAAVKSVSEWFKKATPDIVQFGHAVRNVAMIIKDIAVPAFEFLWSVAKRVWPGIKEIVIGTLDVLKGAIRVFSGLLTGDFGKAWQGVKDIFTGGVEGIKGILRAATAPFREIASRLGHAIVEGVTSGIKAVGDAIKDAANWLKDKIVGTIKSVFHIHSPSLVMADLGLQLAKGLLHGFMGVDVAGFVKDEIGKIASTASGFLGGKAPAGSPIVGGGTVGGSNAGNQRLGRAMLKSFGWGDNQWPALRALWMGESGWNAFATNASSGAYGIPQSLPASKMASAGSDWRTNPATQIRWGLGYIKGRYGSPSAAYQAWQSRSPHWYAGGTGGASSGWAWVGEQGPELVRFSGGEQVLSHGDSMRAIGGYAKGTKKKTVSRTGPGPGGSHGGGVVVGSPIPKKGRAIPLGPSKGVYPGGYPSPSDAPAADETVSDNTDSNQELTDATNRLADLTAQVAANQLKILALTNQGPQILAAVVAAVNGGIGGNVGLGFQSPSSSGQMARYR